MAVYGYSWDGEKYFGRFPSIASALTGAEKNRTEAELYDGDGSIVYIGKGEDTPPTIEDFDTFALDSLLEDIDTNFSARTGSDEPIIGVFNLTESEELKKRLWDVITDYLVERGYKTDYYTIYDSAIYSFTEDRWVEDDGLLGGKHEAE